MRLTRARVAAVILIVALVAVVAFLVNQFVLSSDAVASPEAPAYVAAIENQWGHDILLPTFLPECLTYDPASVSTTYDRDSSSGQSLTIGLTASRSGSCASASDSTVSIVEAPALSSLTGDVSTVSQGRMQFAQVSTSNSNGQTGLTLQWHCADMMCRLSGTLNQTVTETVLKQMADSFQVAKLPS